MTSRRVLRRLLGALVACAAVAPAPAHADVNACIAANEQSLSLRRSGKLKDARKQLVLCAAASCPEELRGECEKRIGAVNAAMPSLVIGAKDGTGNDLAVATVTVDGARVAAALDGRPIELDPGEHVVEVAVTGQRPAERKVVLGEGEKNRHESFVIGPVTVTPEAVVVAPVSETRPWGTQRTVSVIVGSTGVVGVGIGAAFGILASSAWSSSKSASNTQGTCTSAAACPQHTTAENEHDTAVTDATVSTIAFGVGAALVVAGVVSWLTAPSRSHAASEGARLVIAPGLVPPSGPGRAPDGGSLSILGAF